MQPLLALAPRFSLVHVSDTPLPETNHHLPLGRGSVDLAPLAGLEVPLVLEIGGLPFSGGYGLDTDEALVASRAELMNVVQRSTLVNVVHGSVASVRRRRRHRLGDAEGVPDDAQHLLARAFLDRHEAAELEAREADATGGPQHLEAEVARGSPAGRPSCARGSARTPTRPRGSGTRTPRARARRGRAPRRSPRGRATAAPTGSTTRRGTRT